MKVSRHDADVDAQLSSVASLGEPVRRALYRFVAGQAEPVSREQAAAGVEVAHHVAKFHLDKLEDDGLLEVEYRRPAGRTGPGAGRPTKFYRRVDKDISVSLPERRYDLAGRLMAEAITRSAASGDPVVRTLRAAARATGRRLGEEASRAAGVRTTRIALVRAMCAVLSENGYEPSGDVRRISLRNCPFHRLAEEYPDLVCGMNLDLVGGLLDSLVRSGLHAHLDPAPGRCCVAITRSANPPSERQ
jgi:predicted ArsR family transcriptional regulator